MILVFFLFFFLEKTLSKFVFYKKKRKTIAATAVKYIWYLYLHIYTPIERKKSDNFRKSFSDLLKCWFHKSVVKNTINHMPFSIDASSLWYATDILTVLLFVYIAMYLSCVKYRVCKRINFLILTISHSLTYTQYATLCILL